MSFEKVLKNKKILITGNTGFKGSWLSLCLLSLGAKVYGFSNEIKTQPSLYKALKLKKKIKQYWGDVANYNRVNKIFNKIKPDVVFHLAAQSLVFDSYEKPLMTFKTNIMGTANIIELIYKYSIKSSIIITSDKVYENLNIKRGYIESDKLMGVDPYSASKSAAEIVINSFQKSYKKKDVYIAVTRAGNVIGGGDWSKNRIVPDIINSWINNKKLMIRSPTAVRPWQHVLEPINAYIYLSVELLKKNKKLNMQCFNVGPAPGNKKSVSQLLKIFKRKINFNIKIKKEKKYEAKLLILNSNKIYNLAGWKSKLNFIQTIYLTIDWYISYYKDKNKIYAFSINQIKKYFSL